MDGYEEICALGNRAGFDKFTPLQEKAFTDENFYKLEKWLFITGATSSGKTLIALLNYFYYRMRFAAQYKPYRMLFVVPYRALASQKLDEIHTIAEKLSVKAYIVQSTSEHFADDDDILSGKPDIAIVINEKVFMFASSDGEFLNRYDLIVVDEAALVQDTIRGLKTDFILLRASLKENLRVIALGTPFCDWSEYLEKFRFVEIRHAGRPIKIEEVPLECASPNNNFNMVAEICGRHLERGERIIIFRNNRLEVRKLARNLKKVLVKSGHLVPRMNAQECKAQVLREMNAMSEDVLYGTLDTAEFESFACGICYHNANLPVTFRNLVERDFLSDNGHLKIICSTETLAYGINSNADVVIIPVMNKPLYGKDKVLSRPLTPNEYMNYAGRAGRLKASLPLDCQQKVGYVYSLLEPGQEMLWQDLHNRISHPEKIFSKYLQIGEDYHPFYVLSLFPNSRSNERDKISLPELISLINCLPLPKKISEVDKNAVEQALKKLLDRKLITLADSDDEDYDCAEEYELTDIGRKVSGFVINFRDFETILNALKDIVTNDKIFFVDLFLTIVGTFDVLENSEMTVGRVLDRADNDNKTSLPKVLDLMQKVLSGYDFATTQNLKIKISRKLESWERAVESKRFNFAKEDDFFKQLRMVTALLLWRKGKECTPPLLYEGLRIHYEQMWRLAEIVSYRLEIISHVLPMAPSSVGTKTLRQHFGTEWTEHATDIIAKVSKDIFYQPSKEICEMLEIENCDLYRAQKVREVERVYKLLKTAQEGSTKIDVKKIVRQVNRWIPEWREAFAKKFEAVLKLR